MAFIGRVQLSASDMAHLRCPQPSRFQRSSSVSTVSTATTHPHSLYPTRSRCSAVMSGLASALSSALSALSLTSSSPQPAEPPRPTSPPAVSSASSSAPSTSSSSSSLSTAIPDGFTLACSLSTLPLNSRRCLSVSNRALLLFRLPTTPPSNSPPPLNFIPSNSSSIWAIDAICYHMGGPLIEGDIEELLGSPHVVCPWHHYRISIETGEGAYQVMKGQWKSKGRRQRIHEVRVEGEEVYVKVGSSAEGKVESDIYGDRPISAEELEALEKKRKTGGEYKGKGPSGLNRGSTY